MKGLEEIIKENKEADVEQRYLTIKKRLQDIELTKENCNKILEFLESL